MNNLVYFYEKRDPQSFSEYLNQYIVFSPNQIKSIDNRSTFDSNNPNIYWQGSIANKNGNVELYIDSKKEMKNMTEEEFRNKMLNTLLSFKNNKIYNESLGADIEIRTSSIKKYKRFFADKTKRLIVPYIPRLLKVASFKSEPSYVQKEETNVRNYWKSDINIDNNSYNVHLTVKEDDKGNFFWDAQIKENAQLAESVTITGAEGQSNDFSSDALIITPSDTNVNPVDKKGIFYGKEEFENFMENV